MTKKTATPDEISEALAMREAGYTALSISQRLGISIRTLQRHFSIHAVKKGSLKVAVIENARAEMLRRVTSDDTIREEAARLINDDLAHACHLRTLVLDASEYLQATNLKDATQVMRAAAAYSVVIKNTSDTLRCVLGINRIVNDTSSDELPELCISELTAEEVGQLRKEAVELQEPEPTEPDEVVLEG